ncbi:chromosomal replication initiator protein DnaA [[Clostridium] hylemonae]|uniref:Chromosomal replication initiator protein DnaA n=1 Tax=[Clostridium] hylemonae DSM 15053 TaxID=553973 RepID=C0C2W5_9FIRM|nr:chromosomal replication initiator protein DnaA [[Clostridium] hylemonae]EEG73476.1 chromosomal replication initiator protein DnaA [[Clostridium] hylemonae DSM 15053]MCB7522545.1 chromosomal replication initiator protein DnaA [[Clostridium] hylemonae]QEK16034.1 Chromosomal replication initiator protein DnaA [[Clostridium] hylemonae DSM 15053]BDF02939.1 chromosomal replication initiator protein DnaA [[Clostridium] hylemonae]
MNIVKEKWQEIIEHLRIEHELSNVSFSTWIQPLKVYDVIDSTVFILVNMNASVEYIEKKYLLPLKVCIAEITGTEYEIVFLSEDDDRIDEIQNMAIEASQKKKTKSAAEKAGLNPKYTFDTFVVGGNNNFAHAASLAVAESPGEVYNPLFLYGGVGLGKTHLMHSIAHFILEKSPKKKVLYVTSETFTNELIDALKNGKTAGNESAMSKFRDKYRNNDVLLIDDIQFIIGKESTQEEFFHTFNHLHTSGKQIIISSDKPPKDIETLEARLRTRFEWGLIADISAPNYETRMAILQKKIELDKLEKYNIPQDVIEYIATNIKTNIRELEGSLNKLIALYKLNNNATQIDITLASEALKDIISSKNNREVTPELILDIVSEHFGVSIADLKSNKRNADISNPRQIAMYLIRSMTDTPLKSIGIFLGGKDHSTVKHGVDKITKEVTTDETLSNTVSIIKKKINPA